MQSLEQQYYETARFWEEDALGDVHNAYRMEETVRLLPEEVKSLLDAGCGNGLFIRYVHKLRTDVHTLGVDRSETALSYVQGEKFLSSIDKIDLPDKSYDGVSCLEVLEHLPVTIYEHTLGELARLAKNYLIVSVPYDEDLMETMNRCPSCLTVFNANLHLRSYPVNVFEKMFEHHGFTLKKIQFLVPYQRYKYHTVYRKLVYPDQFKSWLSPLCPLCGYSETQNTDKPANAPHAASLFSALKSIPKAIWPKETRYYWTLGLFKRVT